DKILSKQDLQKRIKIDNEKFQFFIDHKILDDKVSYTEEHLDILREFRKLNPLDLNDIIKKFKLNREQLTSFKSFGLIKDSIFFSNKDLDIFQSWQKLKRLGYSDEACFKVLSEVGVPREDNLFENKNLIQLKELSESSGVSERTIKFYEKDNLIPKPQIYKNKRFYEINIMDVLLLIRDLQQIGYKLSNIANFLGSVKDEKAKTKAISAIKLELNEKIKITKAIIKRVETILTIR
ncbi:MAG: MerR family transcriptional regulator, partial [Spirochaetales bacterium]|nr:MerR family transcriptional regulator [Spirochaetales bacterium]